MPRRRGGGCRAVVSSTARLVWALTAVAALTGWTIAAPAAAEREPDQQFTCTEPTSGDLYIFDEVSLPSFATGRYTSNVVITYIKYGLQGSENIFAQPAGHITLVFSEPFEIIAESFGDVQGPYPIPMGTGQNNTLLHVVGSSNSPRFTSSYATNDNAKPVLLAMQVVLDTGALFCCHGDCSLTSFPSPPPPSPSSGGGPPPAPATPVCVDAANGQRIAYSAQAFDGQSADSGSSGTSGMLLVTLNSTATSELANLQAQSDVRLIYSGRITRTGSPLGTSYTRNATTTLPSIAARRTTVYVWAGDAAPSGDEVLSSFAMAYNASMSGDVPSLVGIALRPRGSGDEEAQCCYGNCDSAMLLQRVIQNGAESGATDAQTECAHGGLSFRYAQTLLGRRQDATGTSGEHTYSIVSFENVTVDASQMQSLGAPAPYRIRLQYETGSVSSPSQSQLVRSYGLSQLDVNGTTVTATLEPSALTTEANPLGIPTPGFITRQVASSSSSSSLENSMVLQSVYVNDVCCAGDCIPVPLTPLGPVALVVPPTEEDEVVSSAMESATPAIATTMGASVASSVATSMATTMATSSMTAGAAGTTAGGAASAGAGGTTTSSGGAAQMIMGVQLFSAMGSMKYLKHIRIDERQRSLTEGLSWTNFRVDPFGLFSVLGLSRSPSLSRRREMRRSLAQAGGGNASPSLSCPDSFQGYAALTYAQQLRCAAELKAANEGQGVCASEHDCIIGLVQRLLVIAIVFVVVLLLHVGLMALWKSSKKLEGIPYPPVLAFPNIEILVMVFTFTAIAEQSAALMGYGTISAWCIGGGVFLTFGGGIVYMMFVVSTLAAHEKLGCSFSNEENEIGMDADPLTRCCFPGKNRRSGKWKDANERDTDIDERNDRLLSMGMGMRVSYHVLVRRGAKIDGGDRAGRDHGRHRHRKGKRSGKHARRGEGPRGGLTAGGGASDNDEDAGGKLNIREVDGLARFGFAFNQFQGHSFVQHYWTIMLLVQGVITMPAAFVSSSSLKDDKTVNTIVVAVPFAVLLLQILLLLIVRPFIDRLQWVSFTVITTLQWLTFAVQLFDVFEIPALENIETDVLVLLLWCSSMGVNVITKLYGALFELFMAFKKLYYLFMTKLIFEKADFEVDAAQNSAFIVVKDGVGVSSAVNEYSRQKGGGGDSDAGWWKGKGELAGKGKLKKVQIAPEPMGMGR